MATTTDYIAAQSDPDLLQRFIAAAQMEGMPGAQNWVSSNYPALLGFRPDEGDQTIADVYAYAKASREAALAAVPPAPGVNLAAVTDDYLKAAIQALVPSENA